MMFVLSSFWSKCYKSLSVLVLISLLLLSACSMQSVQLPREEQALHRIESIVVFGFRPFLSRGQEPRMVRSPLSGAIFKAEPVPEKAAIDLTGELFSEVLNSRKCRLIPPGQAKGVFSNLLSSGAAASDIELFQEIGLAFSSDTILAGYVYRWKERVGTEYAIELPASVAFDLYLIRTKDRKIIWKARFDKTQRSLSENLFDLGTFVKSRGRWMSAKELAMVGLPQMLKTLPKKY